MLVLDNINYESKSKNVYVALGSFDGLHLGHLSLINKAKALAKESNGKSMVFTFKNHPRSLIKKDAKLDLLMTNEEKIDVLEKEKIDIVAFKNFDNKIMEMSPENFIQWLCSEYCVAGIIVGFNFKFGYKNLGDTDLLKELSTKYNYDIYIMEPFIYKEEVVSSTRIRKDLINGDIHNANHMLSRTYSITGKVIDGKKLGRKIGFPTANISIPANKLIPKVGVYYTNIKYLNKIYKGITSIGYNPTVNGQHLTIETYILDFNKDIYNEDITVYFIDRIRDEIKFNGIDELISQLNSDKKYAINSLNVLDINTYL